MLERHNFDFDKARVALLAAHSGRVEVPGRAGGAADAMPAATEEMPAAKVSVHAEDMKVSGAALRSIAAHGGPCIIFPNNVVELKVLGRWEKGRVVRIDADEAEIAYDERIEDDNTVCSSEVVSKDSWNKKIRACLKYLPLQKDQNGRVTSDFNLDGKSEAEVRDDVHAKLVTEQQNIEAAFTQIGVQWDRQKLTDLILSAEERTIVHKQTKNEMFTLNRNYQFERYRKRMTMTIRSMSTGTDFCILDVTDCMEPALGMQPGDLANDRQFGEWMLDQLLQEDRNEDEHAADLAMFNDDVKGFGASEKKAQKWLNSAVSQQMDLKANQQADAGLHEFAASQYRLAPEQIKLLRARNKGSKEPIMHSYKPNIKIRSNMHAEFVPTKDFVNAKMESSVTDAQKDPRKFLEMNSNETPVGVRQYCLTLLEIFAKPSIRQGTGGISVADCNEMCLRITAAMDAVEAKWVKSEKAFVKKDVKEENLANHNYAVRLSAEQMAKDLRVKVEKNLGQQLKTHRDAVKIEKEAEKKVKTEKKDGKRKRSASPAGNGARK